MDEAQDTATNRRKRIIHIVVRVIELMRAHPDASLSDCCAAAEAEDLIINGDPEATRPRGLLST